MFDRTPDKQSTFFGGKLGWESFASLQAETKKSQGRTSKVLYLRSTTCYNTQYLPFIGHRRSNFKSRRYDLPIIGVDFLFQQTNLLKVELCKMAGAKNVEEKSKRKIHLQQNGNHAILPQAGFYTLEGRAICNSHKFILVSFIS